MQKDDHDSHSVKLAEPLIETWVFNHRLLALLFFLGVTVFLVFMATKLQPDASLERMIPLEHPYVANFIKHKFLTQTQ